jgi:hypothetical protein
MLVWGVIWKILICSSLLVSQNSFSGKSVVTIMIVKQTEMKHSYLEVQTQFLLFT